jgi:anti-sigma regulatory factor (Ser/Thr protein kinase)
VTVVHLHLTPTDRAPAEARRAVDPMSDRIDRESLDDLKTVITELIEISVAHGHGEPIDLSVTLVDEEIEAVVFDNGPGAEAIFSAREGGKNSLVLRIIDSLVDEWGINPGLTKTWFRMTVAPA